MASDDFFILESLRGPDQDQRFDGRLLVAQLGRSDSPALVVPGLAYSLGSLRSLTLFLLLLPIIFSLESAQHNPKF